MKKLFALFVILIGLSIGITQNVIAQDAPKAPTVTEKISPTDTASAEKTDVSVAPAEEKGLHKALKEKIIEGGAGFMSSILLCFIFGLALAIERILYLNFAEIDTKKLLEKIEEALDKNDLEGAKDICRNTRGPIASIFYQGLSRYEDGIEVVDKAVISYGGIQTGLLERGLPWIALFIGIAPMLGFLGTVVGMIIAFDRIQQYGDLSATIVAGGIKIALITTVGGLIVGMTLQLFYNYIVTKIDSIVGDMEDASISLLDIVVKHNLKSKK